MTQRPPLSPLERRAAFRAAVTLKETTMAKAASSLEVSYNHLLLVLDGRRQASQRLQHAIAIFLDMPLENVFGAGQEVVED